MVEQLADRDRPAVRDEPRQPFLDRVIEAEPPLADELESDRGNERLRNAPDPEAIGRAQRDARCRLPRPVATRRAPPAFGRRERPRALLADELPQDRL